MAEHGNYKIRTEKIQDSNVVFGMVMAGTFGPLVTAFCAELGKRLGGSVADWARRVRLRPRTDGSAKAELVIKVDHVATVVEIDEDLSDEARLALLDLHVESDDIRGHRLRWNAQVEAWLPADEVPE